SGAGAVVDLHSRPAQLLDPAVGEHPTRVVETAMAVGALLQDDHQREVVEPQRDVRPPETLPRLLGEALLWIRRATGPDSPGTVAGAEPRSRVHREVLAVGAQHPRPAPDLGEPAGIQHRARAVHKDVPLLEHRLERALPPQIYGQVFVLAHHP